MIYLKHSPNVSEWHYCVEPDIAEIPKLHIHQFCWSVAAALNLAHHLTDGLHVTRFATYFISPANRMYDICTIETSALSAGILAFVEGRTGRDAEDGSAAETAKETAVAWPIRARWQRLTRRRPIERKADQIEAIRVALSEELRSRNSHAAV